MAHLRTTWSTFSAASALLVATALLAVPEDAHAADLAYTCTDPFGQSWPATVAVDTDAPDTLIVGETFEVNLSVRVEMPDSLRESLYSAGVRTIRETDATDNFSRIIVSVAGGWWGHPIAVASTSVPPTGSLVMSAAGRAGPWGSTTPGTLEIKVDDFWAVMAVEDASGAPVFGTEFEVRCDLDTTSNGIADTVTFVSGPSSPTSPTPTTTETPTSTATPTATLPGPTGSPTATTPEPSAQPTGTPTPIAPSSTAQVRTATTASIALRRGRLKVRVAVRAASGTPAGTVKVALRKGARNLRTTRTRLVSGRARTSFARPAAPGRHVIVVTYLGSGAFEGSKVRVPVPTR